MEVPASSLAKFDPESHRNNVFNAFTEYVDSFEFEYEAIAKEPPASVVDKEHWIDVQKRKTFMGRYASRVFQIEYKDTIPEAERSDLKFSDMVRKMLARYEPAKNYTLANYDFHKLNQGLEESFDVFANRIRHESQSCRFKCAHDDCNVPEIMIRDQIVIGTTNDDIRCNALKNQWDLQQLLENGRKIEAATHSAQRIANEQGNRESHISRVKPGKYSASRRTRQPTSQCKTCSNKSCEGGKKCIA